MTQAEKDQKQAELRALVAEHQTKAQMFEDQWRALDATPVTSYKVWEPTNTGDLYWDSSVMYQFDYGPTETHNNTIEAGLAHPTKEAAERHHEFLKMLRELEAFAVEHNEGWKPDWSQHQQDKYMILLAGVGFSPDKIIHPYNLSILPYFKSQELAQKAIDTFGDRLKILFEYYNS